MQQREGDLNQKCLLTVGKPTFDIDDALWDSFVMLQHLHCFAGFASTFALT